MVVGDFTGLVSNADGAAVAHPAAMVWSAEESDGIESSAAFLQDGPNSECVGAESMLFVAERAIEDGLVGINAAVAEEGPVAAGLFALSGIAFDYEDFLFVVGGFGNDLAERVGDEGIAPKVEARVTFFRFAFE